MLSICNYFFPTICSIFSGYFLLLLYYSGGIELNPDPYEKYSDFFQKCVRDYPKNLKILHLNCRSLKTKSIELKHLVNDIGLNCIYGFTETWLNTFSNPTLFEIQKTDLTCLRNDRCEGKKGGALMLLIPKTLNAKLRTDFEDMNENCESMCVQFTHLKTRQKFMINLSYCPNKKFADELLENLARGIDRTVSQNMPVILMGDYKLNYWDQSDCSKIDTVVVPYYLNINNVSHASRIGNKKGTLIDYDYIITDGSLKINKTYVFDPLIKSDHMATLSILNLTLTKKSTVSTKLVFDKKNLDTKTNRKRFKTHIGIFYSIKDIETLYTTFENIVLSAIRTHAPLRKVYKRNDKPLLSLAQKFVSATTRQLQIKKDLLDNEIFLQTTQCKKSIELQLQEKF